MFHYIKQLLNFIYIGALMLVVIILLALQSIKDLLMLARKNSGTPKNPHNKPKRNELARNNSL